MNPRIQYFIPLPSPPRTESSILTPFQGISYQLCRRLHHFDDILKYGAPNIFELFNFSLRTVAMRICGISYYSIFPIEVSELDKLTLPPGSFTVVFADNETRTACEAWKKRQPTSVLIVDSDEDSTNVADLTSSLRHYCTTVFEGVEHSLPDEARALVGTLFARAQPPKLTGVELPNFGHNVTLPNELTLQSLGAKLAETDLQLVGKEENYVRAIIDSANAVDSIKRNIGLDGAMPLELPSLPSLILTVPGTYRNVFSQFRSNSKEMRKLLKAAKLILNSPGYALYFDVPTREEGEALLSSPEFQAVTHFRQEELTAYTAALCVRAASYLTPVLRLPPAVNHVEREIAKLANCIRANPDSPKKSRLANSVFEKLESSICPEFVSRIAECTGSVTIIADTPIEWLRINGLPLLLRNTTSRIPVTPGNLAIQQIFPHETINLQLQDFDEILIIRSFEQSDPIRHDLQKAVTATKTSSGAALPVRFADVQDRQEFIDALNEYDSAMVVLDCHGCHNKYDDIGKIQLARESVDIWELRNQVRFPPIMYLCACETHAIDRSHATTANGLATCGVRSVIATILPVSSSEAALSAARFLLRVCEYLPIVTANQASVRWNDVFGQFQRMQFVTEVFNSLRTQLQVGPEVIFDAHCRANMLCHKQEPDWYEYFIADLSETFNIPLTRIESILREQLPFPDTLKYVHLGNPESILIGGS